jgi:hypothetical protein
METSIPTTTLVVREMLFNPEEELALAGFLAGYGGLTREAYALDLRQYVTWCTEQRVAIFGARRADIEAFGRHLEILWSSTSHDRPAALHDHLPLPACRRRRSDPGVTRSARAQASSRL